MTSRSEDVQQRTPAVNGETRGAGAGLSGLSFRYLRRENYKKKKSGKEEQNI